MKNIEDRNEGIIKKIKGLLATADDNSNDEESQTAFLLAQKLMLKYNINAEEIEVDSSTKQVDRGQITAYKKLFWWERELARIISYNFRVRFFYNTKKSKRAVMFLGFDQDIKLAKEMYVLAYEAILFYTKRYVEKYYDKTNYCRDISITNDVKNSYMRGFLEGLKKKFEDQVAEMEQEYGLMVLVPKEVTETYDEMFKGAKGISYKIPRAYENKAYEQGYDDGNQIDHTKSTIDDDIVI
ncbi:DUF2786 domain-containing protein [Lysinibacillus sphaericus]|uniref:DUF2786 domain-containing protein n=1 Tax=Lysinibacillus sphaericus TaxID=1421 RepID=UPI003F78D444